MRPDGAPCSVTNRLDLPTAITACLREQTERDRASQGGIISDTKLAWLSKGPVLQVIDTRNGAKVSAWTFGAVVKDFKTNVTCLAGLPDTEIALNGRSVRQLLVGLECELTGGMLCVFNLAGSRVLRAINVPSKITSVSLICAGQLSSPLHKVLKAIDGLAAVGTSDGQVLLIDLQRRKCDKILKIGASNPWECPRDELRPCALTYFTPRKSQQLNYELLDDHFCFHLNERAFSRDQHLSIEFPNKECESFVPENPSITSLLYVPQLASLCIGFACGTFQIWSLQSLSHLYSLPVENTNPVVKMSFQEACDDPNAYCYLWTIKGRCRGVVDVAASGPGCATLHSLCYEEKQWLPGYGTLYKRLIMCTSRFEYDLAGFEGTIGSRLLTLCSVSRAAQGQSQSVNQALCEDSGSGSSSNSISLCLMVWETWGLSGPQNSIDSNNTHMALFDLNQWYADQMPGRLSVRGGPSINKRVAGYLVTYDLAEAFGSCEGVLLDIRIKPDTILQFSAVQNVEEFSRPASLSFSSVVLTDQQIIHLQHPGVQRALLSDLLSAGPIAIISPTNLFHECLALGLRPLLMDVPTSMHVSLEEQRTLILNVTLEQHLGRFVSRCAREWADGRSAAAGCTLSWLLSAIWNRAAVLKQLAVRICTQLFDLSGEKLDSNAQHQLRHVLGVFRSLETFYQTVIQNKWHLSLSEWQQVELQKSAIELECKYYDVLQWFIDVDLLPEGLNSSVPYPSEEIGNLYRSRRQEIHCLQQGKEEKDSEVVTLMIDALIANEPGGANISSDWERDFCGRMEPGLFPPASLQGLLRVFLTKDVSLDVKYSIIIYVLMDLADILNTQQHELTLQKLMQFPAAFHMSLSSMRVTQAFWHLDHKGFDTAVDMLLDPLVSTRDLKPWQHRFVIWLLLLQGQPRLALRYARARQPPVEGLPHIRMHLNLLLANDLINEAFMFQRQHRSADAHGSLLLHFFRGCEERDNLKGILQFSLQHEEEMAFAQYLEHCKHPAADDLRVLYLLKRSRFVEALDVNQELRKKGKTTATRDMVVNAFFKTLPAMTRTLATHCTTQQNKLQMWRKVDRPTPFFVSVKSISPEMRYKSSFLQAAVDKSRETWSQWAEKLPIKLSEVESTPFLCTPRARIKSHLPRFKPLLEISDDCRSQNKKRRREEDTDDFSDPQGKRSRFQQLEGALAELQQQQNLPNPHAKPSTHSSVDAPPLLHTPIIQRRSPASRVKLQQQILSNSPAHRAITPQSIIKVRRSDDLPHCESPSRRILFKEPELTEEESECELSPVSKSKGESDTDSEIEDAYPPKNQEKGIACRTIDFVSDSSSSESLLQSSCNESHFLPSRSPSPAATPVHDSLSKRVVLSEAWKIGKPQIVTFGKDSVCVYDENEPLNSEISLLKERSSDEEDQDCAYVSLEPKESELELEFKDEESLQVHSTLKENRDQLLTKTPGVRLNRLDTSGLGTLEAPEIEEGLAQNDSDVFHSVDDTPSDSLTSVSFRSSLSRPSIKEVSQHLSQTSPKTQTYEKHQSKSSDKAVKSTVCEDIIAPPNLSAFSAPYDNASCSFLTSSYASLGTDIQGSQEISPSESIPHEVSLRSFDAHEDISVKKHSDILLSQNKDEVEVLDSTGEESTLGCSDEVLTRRSEEKSDSEEDIVQLDEDESGFLPESSGILSSLMDEDADPGPFTFSRRGISSQFDSDGSQSILSMETKLKSINSSSSGEASDLVSKYKTNDDQDYHLSNTEFELKEPDFNDSQISLLRESQNLENNMLESDYNSKVFGTEPGLPHTGVSVEHSKDHEECEETNSDDKSQPSSRDQVSSKTSEETEDLQFKASSTGSATNISSTVEDSGSEDQRHTSVLSLEQIQSAEVDNENSEEELNQEEMPKLQLDSSFVEVDQTQPFVSPEGRPVKSLSIHQEESLSVKRNTSFSGILSSQSDCTEVLPAQGSHCVSPVPSVPDHSMHNTSFSSEVSGVSTRSRTRASASQSTDKGKTCSPSSELSDQNSSFTSSILETGAKTRSKSSGDKGESINDVLSVAAHSDGDQFISGKKAMASVESPRRSTRLRNPLTVEGTAKPTTRSRRSSLSSVSSMDVSFEESKHLTSKKAKRQRSTSSASHVSGNDSYQILEQKLSHILEDESASEKDVEERTPSKKRKKAASIKSPSTFENASYPTPKKSKSESKADTTLEQAQTLSDSQAIMEYTTTRRLTRHQHAMMARSHYTSNDHLSRVTTLSSVNEDQEDDQVSDDDKASISSVRSSLRLREKYERQVTASPSSTASTVINPALTPTSRSRRRQSLSDADERESNASPANSRRGRKSLPAPSTPSRTSTPTRRSRRQSLESDAQSVASLSPSTTSSVRRTFQGRGRRLSVSSETVSEQFVFASPDIAGEGAGVDISGSESFAFSPPKMLTMPSKPSHSPSIDSNSSASRRSTRQTRKSVLPVISEESSLNNQSDVTSQGRKKSSTKRRSWYFIKEEENSEENVEEEVKSLREMRKNRPQYSAFPVRKEFELEPVESEDETDSVSNPSLPRRSSRNQPSRRKGRRT